MTEESIKKTYRTGYMDAVIDILNYIDNQITLYENHNDYFYNKEIINALRALKAEIKEIFNINNGEL